MLTNSLENFFSLCVTKDQENYPGHECSSLEEPKTSPTVISTLEKIQHPRSYLGNTKANSALFKTDGAGEEFRNPDPLLTFKSGRLRPLGRGCKRYSLLYRAI